MSFIEFCEAFYKRPLFEHEKKLIKFLEGHPNAKLLHPIARRDIHMTYQEQLTTLFALYKSSKGEENENN